MTSSRPVGWEQLGDYKLLKRFAEGQSCVLRLAIHRGPEHANALRAVKMPRPELAHDPSFTQLLVSEAQLLACIQHPNVVAAHGFGREPGGYVALDYVEGDDFRSLQANGRTLPDPRVVAAIIADVLQGLDAVHDAVGEVGDPLRAVHQAPHARHILVSTDGRARLADFTHARVQRATSERRRPSRLDPGYRAPEQVMTPDQLDARTDLFVLAISFWEALAGQSLFAAASVEQASKNVLSAPIPPPSQVSGQSHPGLDRVCLRALERDPQARFGSAKDMLAALLDAALDIGGIALPAQVGRWVSVQAAAQLQVRRALIGGQVTEPPAPAAKGQSIPPPPAGLDVRQNPDLSRPFDRNKTLMGPGAGHLIAQLQQNGSQRPAQANAGLQPTVLAEPEPAFRPSRPPSSNPPAKDTGSVSVSTKKISSRPAPTGMTYGDRPTDTIQAEGVEVERAVDPPPAASSDAPRSLRGRVTEEYVVGAKRQEPVVQSVPAPRPVVVTAPASSVPPASSASQKPPLSASTPPDAASRPLGAQHGAPHAPGRPQSTPSAPSDGSGRGAPASSPATSSPAPATPSPRPPAPALAVEPEPRSRAATPPEQPRASLPPAAAAAASSPPRTLTSEFLRMTAFAVLAVLLGDGLIRTWFGSPYGAPRVPPLPPAAAAAREPGPPG